MHYHDHSRIDNSVNFPSTIEIKENRAATADSARLLNELAEEAKKNLVKSVIINDNSLNCAALFFQHSIDFSITCYVRFKLNGKEFTVRNEMKRFSLVNPSHNDFLKHIYETVSQNIAIELMQEFIKKGELNSLNHITYYGH